MIVFFIVIGVVRGVGGYIGGFYDIVLEVMILDVFFWGVVEKFVFIFFDEVGYCVVI